MVSITQADRVGGGNATMHDPQLHSRYARPSPECNTANKQLLCYLECIKITDDLTTLGGAMRLCFLGCSRGGLIPSPVLVQAACKGTED